ncbi:hypothetical protein JX266_007553 [Neoarthrinium moseri]|nr:hypothetical protein JX266_007553 [Neoarthrinium moseri]
MVCGRLWQTVADAAAVREPVLFLSLSLRLAACSPAQPQLASHVAALASSPGPATLQPSHPRTYPDLNPISYSPPISINLDAHPPRPTTTSALCPPSNSCPSDASGRSRDGPPSSFPRQPWKLDVQRRFAMSRRYDSRTTIFSPEGRLYQVEYALEAISHAGTAIGILAKDGIVLAAERKVTSKLLEQDTSAEKLYVLNDNMICAVAGMTADANILINYARTAAQRYLLTYNEDIPCEQLVRRLCDLKQGYTQHGGLRPFGVSFIYAGWDPQRQFQLYLSNPSGNYGGWKATSAGANNASASSLLKQDYKEDCTLKEACGMAVKVLSKTMDSTKLSSEKIEFATVGQTEDGKIYHRLWSADEITALLKEHDLAKDESADDK